MPAAQGGVKNKNNNPGDAYLLEGLSSLVMIVACRFVMNNQRPQQILACRRPEPLNISRKFVEYNDVRILGRMSGQQVPDKSTDL